MTIPRDVREQLDIRPGQKLDFIVLGGVMHVVAVLPLVQLRGIAKGTDISNSRDERDRAVPTDGEWRTTRGGR